MAEVSAARFTHKPDHKMLGHLQGKLPLTEPMSLDQVEMIDNASLDILEEVGVVFRDDIALEDWKRIGADGAARQFI